MYIFAPDVSNSLVKGTKEHPSSDQSIFDLRQGCQNAVSHLHALQQRTAFVSGSLIDIKF